MEQGVVLKRGVLSFAKFNFFKPQALVPCPFHRPKERMTL